MATEKEKGKAAVKIADLIYRVNPSVSYDCILMKSRSFVEQMVSILDAKPQPSKKAG